MSNNIFLNFLQFAFVVLLFIGCKKKEVGPQRIDGTPYFQEKGRKVVIGCEGNFGWGNASISIYNSKTKEVSNNVFQTQNNLPLGDVMQSSRLINDKLFLVINNSGKIEVVDTSDFSKIATITGFNSPRYICEVSSTKAYVSDLYANAIHIVNLSNYQITGSIPVGSWTETMLTYNDKLLVTEKGSDKVLIIDTNSDVIVDTLWVGREPNSMVVDSNNRLWVLCSGGVNESIPELYKINLTAFSTEQIFSFSSVNESPNSLRIDSSKNHLLFINNGIYKMGISDSALPSAPFINQGTALFYGLGIDGNMVYVADAIDYVQAGVVYLYDVNGTKLNQIQVGIIPQDFTFIDG